MGNWSARNASNPRVKAARDAACSPRPADFSQIARFGQFSELGWKDFFLTTYWSPRMATGLDRR